MHFIGAIWVILSDSRDLVGLDLVRVSCWKFRKSQVNFALNLRFEEKRGIFYCGS